ncbi:MAG: CDP-alcohol phosphatidyltransferase family protein, partial [Alphaproteobacteria bacterium]
RWLEAAALAPVAASGSLPIFDGVAVFGAAVPLAEAAASFAGARSAGIRAGMEAPFTIRSAADRPAAERRLLRALGKKTDGFMERNVERPISRRLSAWLARTQITPNQMTLLSAAVGLSAAPFFLSAVPLWQTMGALLFLAHSILDGCDGELARLKFQESRWGGILDFWVDNVVHSAIFGCMAVGWSHAIDADWPLALGIAAVLGTLGSAGFVYWRVMRPKRDGGPLYTSVSQAPSGALTQLLDSLSRRDFIYLVLLLSVPGKAAWFLAMAATGAPIFFVLLLVVAAKDRRAGPAVNA